VGIPGESRPVATLWQMGLNGARVRCTVHRDANGLQIRVESPTSVIVSEPFELQPRTFARSQALRDALRRRGWTDLN
jgi:hypothetical protein